MDLYEFMYKFLHCGFYVYLHDADTATTIFEGDVLEACDWLEDNGLKYDYKISWIEPAYYYHNAITINIKKY